MLLDQMANQGTDRIRLLCREALIAWWWLIGSFYLYNLEEKVFYCFRVQKAEEFCANLLWIISISEWTKWVELKMFNKMTADKLYF